MTSSGELSRYNAHVLALLRQIPDIIPLPVLDYPPGGLGHRMGLLLASAFWHMNVILKGSSSCIQLYTLLFQFMPVLVLHDTRHIQSLPGDGEAGSTNRTVIIRRLKFAESGNFVPLLDGFLAACQLSRPKRSTSSLWEKQCLKAVVKSSLAGGRGLAFRSLQVDTCPPPSRQTFDKVAATFITQPLLAHPPERLRQLCLTTLQNGHRHNRWLRNA